MLNACGGRHPDWTDWAQATVDGCRLTYSPAMGKAIAALDADVLWLTTWEERANGVGALFDWPPFPTAGRRDLVTELADPLGWWKWNLARQLHDADPRRFVWIDDDLAFEPKAIEWCHAAGGLAISPDTTLGLSAAELDEARRFLSYTA